MHKANLGFVKNSILVLFLAAVVFSVVLIGGVSAAITSITVTAPNSGEKWSGTESITWTSEGCASGDKVKIYWGKGGTIGSPSEQAMITEVDCSPASYPWNTASRVDDTNYQIKIKSSADSDIFDYSNDFFTIDNTAPTVTDDYADDGTWVGSSQTVTLDPQDTTSGIKEVKYCEGTECDPSTGTVLSSPYEIEYTTTQNVIVKYQAWDNADNPSAIGQYNVKIDKDGPVTTDDSDTAWHEDDQAIPLSPSDGTGSGVADTYYCIYNSGESACTPSTSGTSVYVTCNLGSVCEQIVRYYSVDDVGNEETIKESNIVKIDKEVPVVSGIGVDPDYSSAFTAGTYDISATIDDGSGSNVASCQYTIDGTNYYAADWDSGTCSKFLTASDGTALTINFKGIDSVGNEGTGTSISRTVDAVAPTTTDDSDTMWHASNQAIPLSPSDGTGSGVADTYYCIYNSGESACTPSTSGTSVSVTCPADSVCEKVVRYYSEDNVENQEVAHDSNDVMIDKEAPSVTVNGEPANWIVTQTGYTASAICDDGDGSGCDGGTLVYKTYDTDPGTCSNTYADYTDSATITGHKWVCAAEKDDMENEGFSSPVEFKVASTIQDAIDGAVAGETIQVQAGTYTEDLTINKGLILQGAGASSVTVNGVHSITSSDVAIDGFTFNPNGGIGITIDSSSSVISNIEIENNVFDLTTGHPIGIILGGYTSPNKVSNVEMNYNTFNGPTDKICNPWKIGGYFGNPVGCEVEGVDFEHNTINRCSIPINLHDQNIKDVLINDNIFRNTDGVVYVWEDAVETPTGVLSEFVFTNNDVDSTNSYGVGIDTASPPVFSDSNFGTGNAINYNKFVGILGAYGFEAVSILSTLTSYELNAESNWWEDATGPYHATDNPRGQGDEVSDNVDFYPWAYNSGMDVDTEDPTTTINSPDAGSWQKTNFQVDISDSDTGGSGLYYCQYRVLSNGGETKEWTDRVPCSSPVTLLVGSGLDCRDEGADMCQIEVKATDKGGNTGPIESRMFSIDWTVPTITDDYVNDGTWVNSDQTVTLNPQDTGGSEIATVKYCTGTGCDPSTGTVLSTPYQITYTTTQDTIVRYQAWDTADNPSTIGEYNIKIDKQVPTTTDDYANDGVWVNSDQTITLTPSDTGGSGIKEVKYCEGVSCTPDTVLSSPYQLAYTTTQDTVVRYQTWDNADNPSVVEEFNVKIDKQVPTTTDDYANDGVWVNSDQTITLTPSDTGGSGIKEVKYCEGVSCTPDTVLSSPYQLAYTTTQDTVVRYQTWDNADNPSVVEEFNVKIDKEPPTITDVTGDVSIQVGEVKEISATITDVDSGIASATLYYKNIGDTGYSSAVMVQGVGDEWTANIEAQTDNGEVPYYITAIDNVGNSETSDIYTVTVYDFVLHLYDNWNQISVPKQLDADSVARILASGGVFQYDAVSDSWIYGEDLTSIELGIGYFIESEGEQWIGINYQDEGSVPPSVTDVGLEPGWNLVGYMCTQPGEADEVIPSQLLEEISVVYWYNTGVSSYDLIYAAGHAGEMVEPGKGYWVHIPKFYSGEKLYYINICM